MVDLSGGIPTCEDCMFAYGKDCMLRDSAFRTVSEPGDVCACVLAHTGSTCHRD